MTLEVDFYGRGKFPPLALHSEGHQDTMGLCLYLALSERLTKNLIDLTILDDVVMSVDASHRRNVCELLATKFPGRQFLITTHDKTWARQLMSAAVVSRQNSIEFSRWTIETGPMVTLDGTKTDFVSKIHQDLEQEDVPSAAARLRRGGEQFFEQVCDKLRATIRYRSEGNWDFSDFVSAAIGTYKKYLREAKAAANYSNATLARVEALDDGYDEAIMLNHQGNVSEGSAENIFIVNDGQIITPPLTAGILEGITRDSVIQIIEENGGYVIESNFQRDDLYSADEVFMTGTAAEVKSVTQIDRVKIGNGKLGTFTKALQKSFINVVMGKDERFLPWLKFI